MTIRIKLGGIYLAQKNWVWSSAKPSVTRKCIWFVCLNGLNGMNMKITYEETTDHVCSMTASSDPMLKNTCVGPSFWFNICTIMDMEMRVRHANLLFTPKTKARSNYFFVSMCVKIDIKKKKTRQFSGMLVQANNIICHTFLCVCAVGNRFRGHFKSDVYGWIYYLLFHLIRIAYMHLNWSNTCKET